MCPVTKECPEKYGKRLIGRTDMEDALKRLDNLTHEEARMVTAENLRATHVVDERVRGVDDKVTEVIHGVCKSSLVLRNVQPELLRWKGS